MILLPTHNLHAASPTASSLLCLPFYLAQWPPDTKKQLFQSWRGLPHPTFGSR